MTVTLPVTQLTTLSSATVLSPDLVSDRIQALFDSFLTEDPVISASPKLTKPPLPFFLSKAYKARDNAKYPEWLSRSLAVQGARDWPVRETRLPRSHIRSMIVQNETLPAHLAFLTRVAEEQAALLMLGRNFMLRHTETEFRMAFFPPQLISHLLVGGTLMTTEADNASYVIAPRAYAMRVTFVDQPVSLAEQVEMVGNLEWPVVLGSGAAIMGQPEQSYLRVLSDMNDWLRHARWSLKERASLMEFYQAFCHSSYQALGANADEIKAMILRGPNPFNWKQGYVGALILEMFEGPLKDLMGTTILEDWVRAFYTKLRKSFPEGHPQRDSMKRSMEQITLLQTSKAAKMRRKKLAGQSKKPYNDIIQ